MRDRLLMYPVAADGAAADGTADQAATEGSADAAADEAVAG